MKSRLRTSALILLLFVGMSVVENRAVRSRPIEPADNASAVYKLAGEFRTVFANLLWIKADSYHHEFIEHNPNWCDNKDLLGLFKMITALDPRFVEAYSSGSYILMYGYRDTMRSLAYLHEGITANPKSRELNQLVAMIYAQKLKDPQRALPYARKAVRYAEDDWQRNVCTRMLHSVERMIREKSAKQQS